MNGLVGSTAMTPTVFSARRSSAIRRSTSVLLPAPGEPGDADQVGASGLREDAADEIRPLRGFVLDQADGARDRARVPLEDALGQ